MRQWFLVLLLVTIASNAQAGESGPRVAYFELRASNLEQAQRALREFRVGHPLRFAWNLPERLALDYDFAFSAPQRRDLDGLDKVTVGIVMDVSRCEIPVRLDLPSPKSTKAFPEADRAAWNARVDAMRGLQLLHYQVFHDSKLAKRACAQIEGIAELDVPLVKRKALRDLIRVHLHDRVALILEHYDALLMEYHRRIEKLYRTGILDQQAETAMFAELRAEARALPSFE